MPYWLRALRAAASNWYARHYRLALCASAGHTIRISQPKHLIISGPGVHLGNHCRIDASPDAQVHLSCWPYADNHTEHTAKDVGSTPPPLPTSLRTPQIELGDYCTLSPGVRLIAAQRIQTGHSCTLASNVYVTDADWHDRYHRVFPPGEMAPVKLGNNVWLAEQVIVLKGVSIGDNTIVGAGAVVVNDLPANVVAAGNPARVVSQLDPKTPGTDRKALFEALNFVQFEEQFWRDRAQGNSFWRWLLGVVWPAKRRPR